MVDASVLVAAVADAGVEGTWAEAVIAEGGLVAPHVVLAEATNIIRRLETARRLSRLEAATAASDLLLFEVALQPFDAFAARVWELRPNLTSYDAWYVAVAEAFDLPLATLDRRMARATGPQCRFELPPPSR